MLKLFLLGMLAWLVIVAVLVGHAGKVLAGDRDEEWDR